MLNHFVIVGTAQFADIRSSISMRSVSRLLHATWKPPLTVIHWACERTTPTIQWDRLAAIFHYGHYESLSACISTMPIDLYGQWCMYDPALQNYIIRKLPKRLIPGIIDKMTDTRNYHWIAKLYTLRPELSKYIQTYYRRMAFKMHEHIDDCFQKTNVGMLPYIASILDILDITGCSKYMTEPYIKLLSNYAPVYLRQYAKGILRHLGSEPPKCKDAPWKPHVSGPSCRFNLEGLDYISGMLIGSWPNWVGIYRHLRREALVSKDAMLVLLKWLNK